MQLEGITRVLERLKRKARYSLFRQKWNVGAVRAPVAVVAGLEGAAAQAEALGRIAWMAEDRAEFRADPFVVPLGEGRYRIFYENLLWAEDRGTIACVDWSEAGFGSPVPVLREGHHLSYPFVFEDGGEVLVLPEEGEARQLRAFALSGEGEWGEPRSLIEGKPLIDSTLVRHGGRLWLFATHLDGSENEALHLYHAETLAGPWTEHPGNPVKRERGNARPAGQFFEHKGALFRPAQNCASFYGESIVINEVTRLDEDGFEESAAAEVRMPEGSVYDYGCHTLSHAGEVCVLDAARLESTLFPVLDGLARLTR